LVVFLLTSSSGLRGHRKTYLTILESAGHALFKMVRYVLLRPLRPELDVNKKNYRVRNRESESMATLVKLERALKISLTLRSIIPRSVVLWTLFYLFLSPIYCIYYRYEGSFLCGPEEVLLESA
jgi:hypothetical protein